MGLNPMLLVLIPNTADGLHKRLVKCGNKCLGFLFYYKQGCVSIQSATFYTIVLCTVTFYTVTLYTVQYIYKAKYGSIYMVQ